MSDILRCVLGIAICYLLYCEFPHFPLSWSIVSVALATAENNSNKLAFDRIKANFLGGLVGLALYFIPVPGLILICCGAAVTILLGNLFKLDATVRSALASLVIVFIEEEHSKNWETALNRVACVLIGCFVAMGITLCFNLFTKIKPVTR